MEHGLRLGIISVNRLKAVVNFLAIHVFGVEFFWDFFHALHWGGGAAVGAALGLDGVVFFLADFSLYRLTVALFLDRVASFGGIAVGFFFVGHDLLALGVLAVWAGRSGFFGSTGGVAFVAHVMNVVRSVEVGRSDAS
jgi:hypothetical protein